MKVGDKKNKYPRITELMKTGRETVVKDVEALKNGDLETLGDLMHINQALLYGLGVSNESLESLIPAARKAGAFGAKITGAGGGGCMVALVDVDEMEEVASAIESVGGRVIYTKVTETGVTHDE